MDQKSMDAKIKIVMTQTTYTNEEAKQRLISHAWKVEDVILEFMGGSNIEERKLTNNQKIFKAFRDLY